MPWKECHVMDERLRFVARLLDGEKMAALCEEFGISRKTGYKIYERYKASRRAGPDRPQPPAAIGTRISCRWPSRRRIVRLKKDYPSWGAPKIRERLRPALAGCAAPRSAPCMRCSTATAWCVGGGGADRR